MRTDKIFSALTLVAMITSPAVASDWFTAAMPSNRPTCHARSFDAAALAAHPEQKVTAISLERTARDLALERKWHKLEQFDGTPVIAATLRVHLRNDPASHSVRLECAPDDNNVLVCTNPSCGDGQVQMTGDGPGGLTVSVGGTLKSGQFVAHYIHLDDSCEGRAGGPLVLESGSDDRAFNLAPAAQDNCK